MPRKPKSQQVDLPAIPAQLLEQFGNGPMTAEAAAVALDAFDASPWGTKYPPIAALWCRAWD
nr:hypothetical protein [Burkholderia ubonensis]